MRRRALFASLIVLVVLLPLQGQNSIFNPGTSSGGDSPSVNDFRLTLCTGNPVYAPQPATPTSTNTGANTITFSADPVFCTGTLVYVTATASGLTSFTEYWLRNLGGGTYSFYTGAGNAISDTARVTLSATVTQQLNPIGVEFNTIYLSPYVGNTIGLYSNNAWGTYTGGEVTVTLSALTSGLAYDVFAYNNGGAPALDSPVAWTNGTTRATALSRLNGVWVKSTDNTRRYVGTFYTTSATTTADHAGGAQTQIPGLRYLWNVANRIRSKATYTDMSAPWTYSTATVRQADGASTDKVQFVVGLSEDDIIATLVVSGRSNASGNATVGIGVDSTTAYVTDGYFPQISVASTADFLPAVAQWNGRLTPGYHFISWLENDNDASGAVFAGWNSGGAQSKGGLTVSLAN